MPARLWIMANSSASAGGKSEGSLLVVILDVSDAFTRSAEAQDPTQRLSLSRCLDDVMTFANSFLLLSHENSLAVCLSHQAGSQLVYPLPGAQQLTAESDHLGSGKYEPLVLMNAALTEEVQRVMALATTHAPHQVASSSLLSGAISKCLCYIQRCGRETPVGKKLRSRLLIFRTSQDIASQYTATMNCIFAAQKNNIPIDSCVLWNDSGFLQQASDITGGTYIRVPEPAGILQFLLWVFLPDSAGREHLTMPPAVQVDYRAACFCHQRLVDVGYVCSVCLSIFCQFTPICSTCQTHFKLPNLPPVKSMKAKKKKNNKLKVDAK